MLTRSRVINDASAMAGSPANTPMPDGIPEHVRWFTLADLETSLILDGNLSPENRFVSSTPVQLQAQVQDFLLPGASIESPCYVQVTIDDSPVWWPRSPDVEITNLSQINQNIREGRLAVAFYDQNPIKGKVSWLPIGTETLTVWYDRSPVTDPSADQAQFIITTGYVPLLKLMLAAQMMEMMGKPIGTMLTARITRGLAQWEKYTKRNRQPGCVEKPVFQSRRSRYQQGVWTSEFPVR